LSAVRDEAVVLHARAYGESDAIVSLFAKNHGRISLFARGARASKRKSTPLMASHVVSLELHKKPNAELYQARAIDLVRQFVAFSSDLIRLAAANVVLEAGRELFREGDGNQAIFDLLVATLDALQTENVLQTLGGFENAMLGALGYGESTQPKDLAGFRRRTLFFVQIAGRALPARDFFLTVSK